MFLKQYTPKYMLICSFKHIEYDSLMRYKYYHYHDILEKLTETLCSSKTHPKDNDFSTDVKALIIKQPCFSDPGPQPG